MLETQEVDSYRTATNHIYKRKNGASKNIIDENLFQRIIGYHKRQSLILSN